MERIKELEDATGIVDRAISETSTSLPVVRDFLRDVRKYLEEEQKRVFSETFALAA